MSGWNWVQELERCRLAGKPVTLVTVVGCTGSTPRNTGAKMIVFADGTFRGTIGGGHLEELAIRDAGEALAQNEARSIRYPLGAKTGQCCGGIVELLMEPLGNGPKLYLFGAGHVGQAVCRTLAGTPFEVHLIDEREAWLNAPGLPEDTIKHPEGWEDFLDRAPFDDEKTFVAIMTHRHDDDEAIVARVVRQPAAYLGLIGSGPKWERFRQRLSLRGTPRELLDRVKCPIGLDLGGKAPQEIAISLAAEVLGAYYAARKPAERETATAVDSARRRQIESHPSA